MAPRKSLCSRIKRNKTSCKKFHGCKFAEGPKRKFCRTRKNKKRNAH